MKLLQLLLDLLKAWSQPKPDPVPVAKAEQERKEALQTKQKTWKLLRKEFREDGIFSDLLDENDNLLAKCIEHSYNLKPIITDGQHLCVRGKHRLEHMTEDFETFEIMGVQGHTNLLFHWGNWNKDSSGCCLVGQSVASSPQGQMITNSKYTFAELMKSLAGVNEFILVVS